MKAVKKKLQPLLSGSLRVEVKDKAVQEILAEGPRDEPETSEGQDPRRRVVKRRPRVPQEQKNHRSPHHQRHDGVNMREFFQIRIFKNPDTRVRSLVIR